MKKLFATFTLLCAFGILQPSYAAPAWIDVTIHHLEVELGDGTFVGGVLVKQSDGKYYVLVRKDEFAFKELYATLLSIINSGKNQIKIVVSPDSHSIWKGQGSNLGKIDYFYIVP